MSDDYPQTEEPDDLGPDTPDYMVGYKRPPIATRFQKGQSGNPKGPLAKVTITVSAGQKVRPLEVAR
jgi:hypothetical protein